MTHTISQLRPDSRCLAVDILDKDTFSSDDFIGRIKIPLTHFQDQQPHDAVYRLSDGPGTIHLRVLLQDKSRPVQPSTPFGDVVQSFSGQVCVACSNG